ncbi:25510_t:CDS:1, partial [Gigaspora rosea]
KNGLSKSKNSTSRPTSRISSKSASSTSRPTSRISLPEERRQERQSYFHQVSSEETQQFSQLTLPKEHFQHMLPEEHQQQFRSHHNRQESFKTNNSDLTCVSAPANLSRGQELLPPNSIQTLNNVHSIELSSAHNSVYNTNGSQLNLIPNSGTMVNIPSPTISYPFSDEKRFNFNRGDPAKFSTNSKKSKRKLWIILALLA